MKNIIIILQFETHGLFIQWKICNVDRSVILVELSNQKLCESKSLKPNKKKQLKAHGNVKEG